MCKLIIKGLLPLLITLDILAKTTILHAVGIDPENLDQNHDDFYQEAQDFIDYCKLAKLKVGSDCKLYINLDVPRKKDIAPKLTKKESMGAFSPERVLNDFRDALKNAKRGDQVVLSLHDHGAPGFVHASCIYGMGEKSLDSICMNDVEEILEQYKKPGVKVFVAGAACMSGAFNELSSKEVCTYAGADRFRFGGATQIWPAALKLKREGRDVNLTNIKKRVLAHIDLDSVGGGFGSQVIKARICAGQQGKNTIPLAKRNELASQVKRGRDTMYWQLKQNVTCEGARSDMGYATLYNLAGNVSFIVKSLEKLSPEVSHFRAKYCSPAARKNAQLCHNLSTYESLFTKLSNDQTLEKQKKKFSQRVEKLSAKDRKLSRKKGAAIQVRRGALLKEYNQARADFARFINHHLQSVPYQKLIDQLDKIYNSTCFDRKGAYMSDDEKFYANFSLSALRSDHVPHTTKALKEARQCESSFLLP